MNKVNLKNLTKSLNYQDEICQCGHSKGYHKPHILDKHGGECDLNCDCKIYTWKAFVRYEKC